MTTFNKSCLSQSLQQPFSIVSKSLGLYDPETFDYLDNHDNSCLDKV